MSYVDVRDDPAARKVGEEAAKKIESTHPEYVAEQRRERLAEGVERYEARFVDVSRKLITSRKVQIQEAGRIRTGERRTTLRRTDAPHMIDAIDEPEKAVGKTAAATIAASKKRTRKETKAEGALIYMGAQATAAVAGIFEGVTAIARPYNIPRGISQAAETIRDPGKFQKAVARFQADPLMTYISVPSAYIGASLTAKGLRHVTAKREVKTVQKYPSELTGERATPYQTFGSYIPPKGTRIYTDYSGEVRRYIPASETWKQLVQGGDQFSDIGTYTDLMTARPTGPTIPKTHPYTFRRPSIAPIPVEIIKVTPRISMGVTKIVAGTLTVAALKQDTKAITKTGIEEIPASYIDTEYPPLEKHKQEQKPGQEPTTHTVIDQSYRTPPYHPPTIQIPVVIPDITHTPPPPPTIPVVIMPPPPPRPPQYKPPKSPPTKKRKRKKKKKKRVDPLFLEVAAELRVTPLKVKDPLKI